MYFPQNGFKEKQRNLLPAFWSSSKQANWHPLNEDVTETDHLIMVEGNNAASFSNPPFYLAPRPADLVRMLPISAPF